MIPIVPKLGLAIPEIVLAVSAMALMMVGAFRRAAGRPRVTNDEEKPMVWRHGRDLPRALSLPLTGGSR